MKTCLDVKRRMMSLIGLCQEWLYNIPCGVTNETKQLAFMSFLIYQHGMIPLGCSAHNG